MLIFGDAISRCWSQITEFRGEVKPQAAATGSTRPLPMRVERRDLPEAAYGKGDALVRDERGVRLARSEEHDD